ncbi:MAG: ATP-binding cassette domain-containing protein [Vicinamibacteria bacterium]|nr:ATP-binding cassette domain-containing protein [Vicinamibacteria bacterium]
MAEHSPIVEARDLRVFYDTGSLYARRHWAVGPISFHVHDNEFVGLAGPNGSGKTSIGKALLNLIPTWDGDVYWTGRNIRRISIGGLRRQFGWIGQEPTLAFNPRRRIIDILRETLAVNRVGGDPQERIVGMCADMNLDPALLHRYPFELSAGQIQRFALIRVFMIEPRFVLLDEPTSSLDPLNQAQILRKMLAWRQQHGLAALIISHSHRLLAQLCDRVLTLEGAV